MNLIDLQTMFTARKLGLRVTLDHRGWTAIVDRTPIVMFGTADTIEAAIREAIDAYDKVQK